MIERFSKNERRKTKSPPPIKEVADDGLYMGPGLTNGVISPVSTNLQTVNGQVQTYSKMQDNNADEAYKNRKK